MSGKSSGFVFVSDQIVYYPGVVLSQSWYCQWPIITYRAFLSKHNKISKIPLKQLVAFSGVFHNTYMWSMVSKLNLLKKNKSNTKPCTVHLNCVKQIPNSPIIRMSFMIIWHFNKVSWLLSILVTLSKGQISKNHFVTDCLPPHPPHTHTSFTRYLATHVCPEAAHEWKMKRTMFPSSLFVFIWNGPLCFKCVNVSAWKGFAICCKLNNCHDYSLDWFLSNWPDFLHAVQNRLFTLAMSASYSGMNEIWLIKQPSDYTV